MKLWNTDVSKCYSQIYDPLHYLPHLHEARSCYTNQTTATGQRNQLQSSIKCWMGTPSKGYASRRTVPWKFLNKGSLSWLCHWRNWIQGRLGRNNILLVWDKDMPHPLARHDAVTHLTIIPQGAKIKKGLQTPTSGQKLVHNKKKQFRSCWTFSSRQGQRPSNQLDIGLLTLDSLQSLNRQNFCYDTNVDHRVSLMFMHWTELSLPKICNY